MEIKHLNKVFSLVILIAMIFSLAVPVSAATITGEVPDGWTATGRATYYNSTIYQNSKGITVKQDTAAQHSGIACNTKLDLNEPIVFKLKFNTLPAYNLVPPSVNQNGLYITFSEKPQMYWYGVHNAAFYSSIGKNFSIQLSDTAGFTRVDLKKILASASVTNWNGGYGIISGQHLIQDNEYTIQIAPHATKGYEVSVDGYVVTTDVGANLNLTDMSNAITAGNISNMMYLSVGVNNATSTGASITLTELNGVSLSKLNNEVSLQKSGEDFFVGITDWQADHQYQIWSYQAVDSGVFEGLVDEQNQWILSHAYTLGSDRTAGGFTEVGDAITRNIGTFTSVDSNYTIAVRVLDGAGNFIGQHKETFTQAEAGVVVINKVEVDGAFADERAQVKDIANESPVAFTVTGNGVAETVYTAKVDQTGQDLIATGAGLNEFSWDISGLAPGNYSVTLTAATATSTNSRTVSLRLYKNDPAIVYGELTGLEVAGLTDSGNYQVDISPTVSSGDSFRYRLSEPWRSPFYDSGTTVVPAGVISDTNIPADKYGIYQVAVYTYRLGVASADDGDIKTVNNERGGVSLGVDVAVNETPAAGDPIAALKGDGIMLTAAATGIPSAEYSFWRRDANGWVLIRDYAAGGEVVWTPNRVGLYTIQVRAKDAAGLTYEAVQNIEFDITDAVDTKAVVTDITINQATLDSDAAARTPITITANAVSASEDLLYKFIISNGYIYYVETPYSVDPTYIWVPGKAGNYTISVLVKNRVSFGKYDAVGSFVVNVN